MKRALRLAALATALLACSRPASAQTAPAPFYRATVIVTGADTRSRPAGFAQALQEVLVRVSGDPRLLSDVRVAALASHADSLVQRFAYVDPLAGRRPHDDQGTYDRSYDLTVWFDPAGVDAAIRTLGSRPWAGPRPALAPVIAVRGSDPPWVGAFLLTADGPSGAAQRTAFANAAERYGIEVRLPTTAELQASGIRLEGKLPERPAVGDGSISVVGEIEYRPAALGWVGSWRTAWGGVERRTTVSGVSFDEAFDRMVAQAASLASGHAGPD